jgi:uncharacterized protein YbjT (DUF2867 family)
MRFRPIPTSAAGLSNTPGPFRRPEGSETKYFVTGATGFIGGHVVWQLVAAGHRVVAVVRDPSRAQDLRTLGVDIRPGDVTERESLRSPLTGVDGVFHVAGW